jgi:hypothetical protein
MKLQLKDFTLDELAEQYYNISAKIEFKRATPGLYAWSVITAKKELADIWQTMLSKIPVSHLIEINETVAQANKPFIPIGSRHYHKHCHEYNITVMYQLDNTEDQLFKCCMYQRDELKGTCTFTARQIHRHFIKY